MPYFLTDSVFSWEKTESLRRAASRIYSSESDKRGLYQIRLPKPLYKNRPNLVFTRIEGYIDKGGMRTGFGIRPIAKVFLVGRWEGEGDTKFPLPFPLFPE